MPLPDFLVEDVRVGAENIRVAIKEKYLGREAGKKRGETSLSYSSDLLVMVMSGSMIAILGYVSRQVSQAQKSKLW